MNNKIVKGKMILVNDFSLEFPDSWNYNEIESYIIEHINSIRNNEEEIVIKFEDIKIINDNKEEKKNELD